jgi:hypothetical protein
MLIIWNSKAIEASIDMMEVRQILVFVCLRTLQKEVTGMVTGSFNALQGPNQVASLSFLRR